MPCAGGVDVESFSSASSTRRCFDFSGSIARRNANGSCFAATRSSSMKLSIAKPVTELPTARQNATGSLVWTGDAATSYEPNS